MLALEHAGVEQDQSLDALRVARRIAQRVRAAGRGTGQHEALEAVTVDEPLHQFDPALQRVVPARIRPGQAVAREVEADDAVVACEALGPGSHMRRLA